MCVFMHERIACVRLHLNNTSLLILFFAWIFTIFHLNLYIFFLSRLNAFVCDVMAYFITHRCRLGILYFLRLWKLLYFKLWACLRSLKRKSLNWSSQRNTKKETISFNWQFYFEYCDDFESNSDISFEKVYAIPCATYRSPFRQWRVTLLIGKPLQRK